MRKNILRQLAFFFATLLISAASFGQVVISQIYGGGGNLNAIYQNDFIEIFNRGSVSVNITGWSVQYAPATSLSWTVTNLPAITLSPGQYCLVKEASGGAVGSLLPTADATGTINMSATTGKIALVNSTTAISVNCPSDASIQDFIGYGTTADCREGGGTTAFNAPTPSATVSDLRAANGCTDAGNNSTDFATGAPNPRNTATALNPCSAPTLNVSAAVGTDAVEGSTNGSFTITFSPATTANTSVNYSLTGTAGFSTDYGVTLSTGSPSPFVAASGTITVSSGTSTVTLTVGPVNDAVSEVQKNITLTISAPTGGYILGATGGTINLFDDDFAPVLLTGIYTQDFNSILASTGTGSCNSILTNGWGFSESLANANTTYTAGTGSSGTADTYSFGAASNSERAFGTVRSGTLISTIGAAFTNNTGTTVTALKIIYAGEQWRLGTSGRNDRFDFQYSLNATKLSDGDWTAVSQLGFTAPIGTGSVGALDGNLAANRKVINFTITGLSISNGSTFFIRWLDVDVTGADDGLGIDNFSIEPNPVDLPPIVSSFTPANGATNVATNTTAIINFNETIVKGTGNIVIKKTTDNSVFQTIDVTTAAVTVSSTTASFNIVGLAENTGYYIEVDAGAFKDVGDNIFAGFSGNSTWAFTTGIRFYSADFNTCTSGISDGFSQYSVTGAIVWACTSFGRDPANLPFGSAANGVQINGFSGGTNVPNVDWLISPSFNLVGKTFPLLSFWSRTKFNGQSLQLKVSTDYVSGDPTLATWTDLNGKFPGQTSDAWTLSENINLTAFKQANTHFAFVYTSTDEDGARWTMDDVILTNSPVPPPPSLTVSTNDIQFPYTPASSSSDKTFTFIGNDITGDVTINSTGVFSVSRDGFGFSSSISFTQAEANNVQKTVYVRFSPTSNGLDYTGTATVNTSSLSSVVNLKGSSLDPATTLEVVNWNIEWFGSTTFGPTNENLQEQNIRTILQDIGADIFGLVEVVDETRLANVVATMPGYSYIVGQFGSHVNPPEPSGGPLSEAQKLAFVYKTSMFSNVSVRPMINLPSTSASYNNWSGGRYPFLMTADVTTGCNTKRINFVLIHAKANTSPTATSYARRQAAANELHDTLNTFFANENVLVLGDFNDDLDQSITDGFTTTSYSSFTTDPSHFFSPTLAELSSTGKKSTTGFDAMIDHVMLSNELQPYYMTNSAAVLSGEAALVTNYANTTTDHYPVFTRYLFPDETNPTIDCPDNIITFNDAGTCGIVVNYPAVTFSDNCIGSSINQTTGYPSGSFFPLGTTTNTFVVTDGAGNTATCSFDVTVNYHTSNFGPVTVFAGVTNSDNNGRRIDLLSELYLNHVLIGSGSLSNVQVGGNAMNNSTKFVIPLDVSNVIYTEADLLELKVSVRRVAGSGNFAVRLWYNADSVNGTSRAWSRMKRMTPEGPSGDYYYLRNGAGLFTTAGNAGMNSTLTATTLYQSFGTWSTVPIFHCGPPPEVITARINPGSDLSSGLGAIVSPNPTAREFRLMINSDSESPVTIKVTDLYGRLIMEKMNIAPHSNLSFGTELLNGVYFAELIQGKEKKVIKLIKIN